MKERKPSRDRRDRALSAAERMDARAAILILKPSGLSLTQAANIAALKGRRATEPMDIQVAADRFVRARMAKGRRETTVHYYETILSRFAREIRVEKMADLTAERVEQWISSLANGSRASHWRAVRALLKWGLRERPPLVAEDWTSEVRIETRRTDKDGVSVLSVEMVEKLLAGARSDPTLLSCLALQLFAGVRPMEIASISADGLAWESVLVKDRILRVPAVVSKVRRTRALDDLPDTVWEWLAIVEPGTGPIWTLKPRALTDRQKAIGGYGPKNPWPQDVLRHTFASMAIAAGYSISQVCLWLGHEGNPNLLHRHYRGLVPKGEAEKFWALRPPAVGAADQHPSPES